MDVEKHVETTYTAEFTVAEMNTLLEVFEELKRMRGATMPPGTMLLTPDESRIRSDLKVATGNWSMD